MADTSEKKPTPTQVKKELEDLKVVAGDRQLRIRKTEEKIQRVRDILKTDGDPGLTMTQDHYRLKTAVDQIRKILEIEVEGRDGET